MLWDADSGPLSERIYSGTPRERNSSAKHSCTFSAVSLLRTRVAKHSRMNSSITVSIFGGQPLCVRSTTMS
jgi:hypothetical protein